MSNKIYLLLGNITLIKEKECDYKIILRYSDCRDAKRKHKIRALQLRNKLPLEIGKILLVKRLVLLEQEHIHKLQIRNLDA